MHEAHRLQTIPAHARSSNPNTTMRDTQLEETQLKAITKHSNLDETQLNSQQLCDSM